MPREDMVSYESLASSLAMWPRSRPLVVLEGAFRKCAR
jgi:hypothetical protein